MSENAAMINVWTFPDEDLPSTVFLMSSPVVPLCYMSLSIVGAAFSDQNCSLKYHQLVHLAALWTLSWHNIRKRRLGLE